MSRCNSLHGPTTRHRKSDHIRPPARQRHLGCKVRFPLCGRRRPGTTGREESSSRQRSSPGDNRLRSPWRLVLKAHQELSKIDRNMADLRSQWRNEAVSEFNKGQQALSALLQQARSASGATGESNPTPQLAKARCEEAQGASYLLVRGSNGVLQAFHVASKNRPTQHRALI